MNPSLIVAFAEGRCAGSAQDGDSRAGTERAFVDNGDGTVTDLAAGLVWEAKCDGPSCSPIHDKDTGCTGTSALVDHIAVLNEAVFAGYDDWRLPNVLELESPVDLADHLVAPVPSVCVSGGFHAVPRQSRPRCKMR